MSATRHIASDLHVVGLVGQDKTRRDLAFQQSSKNRGIGRVAANDAMRTELKHIANPGDRSGWIWLERPLLQPLGGVTENDMVDLGRGEPGHLYWRVQQDQFFKLNLQRIQIPL